MSQVVATQKSLPFRRQRFVARHRKRSIWLRLWKPFAKALLVVGVPTLLGYWVLTAPAFTLRSVQTGRLEHVEGEWIQQRLGAYLGRPLVSMPMNTVEQRLRSHAWVDSVEVSKRLPDQLLVNIRERIPVLVLRGDDGAWFVDHRGAVIAPWDAESRWHDLPVVEGSDEDEVLAQAATLIEEIGRIQPRWGAEVSRIEALNGWDFRVHTGALPFALVVSAETATRRMTELSAHVESLRRVVPKIETVDLRVAGSIVLKPVTKEE